MAFSLSFSERFYITEDCDSFETKDFQGDSARLPTTVYQAILAMEEEEYQDMCKEVFGRRDVDTDDIMTKIRETDTCTNLSPPDEVWIDEEGWHTVKVYDEEQ